MKKLLFLLFVVACWPVCGQWGIGYNYTSEDEKVVEGIYTTSSRTKSYGVQGRFYRIRDSEVVGNSEVVGIGPVITYYFLKPSSRPSSRVGMLIEVEGNYISFKDEREKPSLKGNGGFIRISMGTQYLVGLNLLVYIDWGVRYAYLRDKKSGVGIRIFEMEKSPSTGLRFHF